MKQFSLQSLAGFCLIAFLSIAFVLERSRADKYERQLEQHRAPIVAKINKIETTLPTLELAVEKALEELKAKREKLASRDPLAKKFSFSLDYRGEKLNVSGANDRLQQARQELEGLRKELEPLK